MIRKTKAEVAHLLPAIMVNIDWRRDAETPTTTNDFSVEGMHAFATQVAPTKVRLAADIALEQLRQGTTRLVVATHLIDSAEQIAGRIAWGLRETGQDDSRVYCVTGNVPTKKRAEILREACTRDDAILVATMHSVGVGIDDLKRFKTVLIAELYWSPMVMIQLLGRFCRLGSGDSPVNVRMLALRGTVDEAIALALETKINAALKLNGVGQDGEILRNGFDCDNDEEDFLAMVRQQVSTTVGTDEYNIPF
jgi:hypothetical protein